MPKLPLLASSPDGTRVAFEVHGEGPPLVLLHGLTETRASWTAAGYTAALVEARFRVVLVDARGHGDSGKPRHPEAYAGARRLADLAAVLDALAIGQAAVMGYSMGGVAALAAAAGLRGRVTAAVALGAHPFAEDLTPLRHALAAGVDSWIDAIEAAAGPLDAATRARIEANDADALRAGLARDRVDFSRALAAGRRPVLALLGTRDPRHLAIDRLKGLGNVEVRSLPGVDHFGTFLAARSVLPEVLAFLSTRVGHGPAEAA